MLRQWDFFPQQCDFYPTSLQHVRNEQDQIGLVDKNILGHSIKQNKKVIDPFIKQNLFKIMYQTEKIAIHVWSRSKKNVDKCLLKKLFIILVTHTIVWYAKINK